MPMFVSDTLARGTTTARLIPGRGTMLSSRKRMLRASESMPGGTLPTSQRVPSPPNVDNTIGLGVGTCYTLFMATTIVERFWARTWVDDGCWIWYGPTYPNGYGYLHANRPLRTTIGAHRVSWIIHFGPIPDELHVLHKCDNPPCVNPEHLFIGTPQDNVDDMIQKGRNYTFKPRYGQDNHNGAKTCCKRGHEFTPENTKIQSNGNRACRTCINEWNRLYRPSRAKTQST